MWETVEVSQGNEGNRGVFKGENGHLERKKVCEITQEERFPKETSSGGGNKYGKEIRLSAALL